MTKSTIAGWLRKFSERGQAPGFGNPFAEPLEHLRICAQEAVNRLLEVADEEQFSARDAVLAADRGDQFDLQGVGVLGFVDQQELQMAADITADFNIAREQVVGFDQDVVEIERLPLAFGVAVALLDGDRQRQDGEADLGRVESHGGVPSE